MEIRRAGYRGTVLMKPVDIRVFGYVHDMKYQWYHKS